MIWGGNKKDPRQARAVCKAGGSTGHGARCGNGPGRSGGNRGRRARPRRAAPRRPSRQPHPPSHHRAAHARQPHEPRPSVDSYRPGRAPYVRHPRRRHAVVLGRQRQRPARYRRADRAGFCRGRSPPRPRAGGPASLPAATTPARRAPTAPCGAGATTTTASSVSATGPSQDLPRQVTTPATGGWASVTAGDSHTCATRTDGTLWCWGDNGYGQLGSATTTRTGRGRSPPRPRAGGPASPPATTSPAPPAPAAPCGAGATTTTASSASATTPTRTGPGRSPPRHAGGWASVPPATTTPAPPAPAAPCGAGATTATASSASAATSSQDRPQQVTTPARGRLGQRHCRLRPHLRHPHQRHPVVLGPQPQRPARSRQRGHRPGRCRSQVTTPAAEGWATVAAGSGHTCATRSGGSLWCWGWNDHGQLGIGSRTSETDLPRRVAGCRGPRQPARPGLAPAGRAA